MTVYELIQELAKYNPDTRVDFHVIAKFETDVKAEFNREIEDDIQEVTVDAKFDDDVDFEDIDDHESNRFGEKYIQINLSY